MKNEKTISSEDKKKKKKRIILFGLGTAVAGIGGYFGWQWWKTRRAKKEEEQEDDSSFKIPSPPQQSSFLPSNTTPRNDDFPLKKGSKGAKVKTLQQSLIAKYGKRILPKYGADGDFGSETVNALKKLNLPEEIDDSTFNVLTKGNAINASEVAKTLYKNAVNKNLAQVLFTLRGMKSREDYSAASEEFKKYPLRGVRQTLVNGLLDSFSDDKQKQQIRLEFSRMGLKYDGSKWSLSGIEGPAIITNQKTVVWKSPREGIKVPAGMILGTEITERDGYTAFENNGENFLVETKTIKHL
ncbi:MAG: hypothetical protein HY841_03940 [Bacteroidetes bacterium]|nr:hypothetical protein [Bacteroidota bacterium]